MTNSPPMHQPLDCMADCLPALALPSENPMGPREILHNLLIPENLARHSGSLGGLSSKQRLGVAGVAVLVPLSRNIFYFFFGIILSSACGRSYSPVRRLPWAGHGPHKVESGEVGAAAGLQKPQVGLRGHVQSARCCILRYVLPFAVFLPTAVNSRGCVTLCFDV